MITRKLMFSAVFLAVLGYGGFAVVAVDNAAAGETVPLVIDLPKPAYEGTPKNVAAGIEVEKPTGKPRAAIQVPKGTVNLALKKKVTASDDAPVVGKAAQVTDGDKAGNEGSYVEFGPGLQWVQIDLEKAADIHALVIWHYHRDPRVYKCVVVQVSDDADFVTGVTTVFNNDQKNDAGLGVGKDKGFYESNEGKLIEIKGGVKGRYVRLYSRGSTADDDNHYTEVEVYGTPAK